MAEDWKYRYLQGNVRRITTRNRFMKDQMRSKPADIASRSSPDVPFGPGLQITLFLNTVR